MTNQSREHKIKEIAGSFSKALGRGGYDAADRGRREVMTWLPGRHDADGDTLRDLPRLRELCADAVRNTPIIAGAIHTMESHVIADGLTRQAKINARMAGISEDQARQTEEQVEDYWRLWSESHLSDVRRQLPFKQKQKLQYRSSLENGDAFSILTRRNITTNGFALQLQDVEADRISNPHRKFDTNEIAGGVERTKQGAPFRYHLSDAHPGSRAKRSQSWRAINAYQATTGLPNIIHVTKPLRIGQTRGIPFAAPILILSKTLARYTDAEMMGALINAMLTVFLEPGENSSSIDGEILDNFTSASPQPIGSRGEQGYELGNGVIIDLEQGDKVHTVDPTRPNVAFDAFTVSIMRQMGVAVGLPYEVLIKHFTASYAAARASLLEAARTYENERAWFVASYCEPIARVFLWELFSSGKVSAPGYFTDPLIRAAYNGALWNGKGTMGQIDPLREINAAEKRINLGISTYSEVTAEMTGGDWEAKHTQLLKENEMIKELFSPTKKEDKPLDDTVQ
jgi:lambda family phage portal protein